MRATVPTQLRSVLSATLLGAFGATIIATPSNAQNQSNTGTASPNRALEEIIVTASKRAESIQDVPISIAAITADEIDRRGLVSAEDYLRGIPGVNQTSDPVGSSIIIRGVETSPSYQNYSSGTTVATYFGETPTTNSAGQVMWTEPLHSSYHGYDIYMHGLPANGGVNLVEAMNLAEVSEVAKLGRYAQSPRAAFTLAQILKPAELFDLVLKDPKIYELLGLDRSLEGRVKRESAVKLWEVMRSGRIPTVPAIASMPVHSDAIVSVDRWGNIAAVCHSINTVAWGATGINVDGISIPDSASFQRAEIAKVTPGKRLPDPSSPGLVVSEGRPFMGFSSIGAGLHARTVTALISVLDFGMTPQQAIDEPSLGSFSFSADGTPVFTVGKNEFSPEFIAQVSKLGQQVVENDQMRGYWIGVQIDPRTGELHGGAIRELAMGGRAVGY